MEDISKKISEINRKIQEDLNGLLPLNELMDEAFMQSSSRFKSFDDMLDNCGYKVETEQDFIDIPEAEWDLFIKNNTSFNGWAEMQQKAADEYTYKKLKEAGFERF
ncbi:hypothetical protein DFR58_12629 [Anaerobacterium chartisolvens]|uniref:Uncharacterized protein n=1 Tax=Anaerobacterium chartisolvens TaxID=1297424 RepID=A0A369ASL4_9FIRM|nr:hypothetical protein [Anaerobacterium chartisolvens]RCX11256.1 hypothetical protein DFR58_12629 [Anaerobacterium chartisolvens]